MFFLRLAQLSPIWESIVESVRMQTGGSPGAWLALIGRPGGTRDRVTSL